MNFDKNTVYVTGAMGWLGIGLVHSLIHGLHDHESLKTPQENLKIRCMIMRGEDASALRSMSDRIEVISGDLRNTKDCEAFLAGAQGSVIFHTAGIIHPNKISDFYDINVEGTKNLLNAAIHAKAKRIVVVSSNSPSGCNPHPDHLFDEHSPYNPYMNYGRSKMIMEQEVGRISQKGDIEAVIVRPPWFYGPFQPPGQNLFFKMIKDGQVPIVGSGNNMRSMGYIDNLCQGILLAALSDRAKGNTYWIADKKPYTMNQIVDTIERLLEEEFGYVCKHKRLKLPGIASEVAYAADYVFQSMGIYNQKIHVLSEMNKNIACSVAKAEKELGYSPKVDLEEGMRRSIAWCHGRGLRFD